MASNPENSLGEQSSLIGRTNRSDSDTHDKSLSDDVTFAQEQAKVDQANSYKDFVELADRYQLERTLGQGGMGRVDLAIDLRLGRNVAIKRIRESTASNSTSIERFLSEAKAIATLSHPNIVQIYDFGWTKEGPYIIMEYVDGGNLQGATQRGPISVEQAIDVICRLCDALEKAHDAGIIHRDIKPANILLTKDGIPKLTDFGLAKTESADAGMTMAGTVLGTLDFMPPEQRRDASLVDARSDLWSLAATLYQMVTGKSPKVIRLYELNKSLQNVLGKALEESKEDRYQNAKELKEALRKSQYDAAPVEELAAGSCPHCGTTNPTTRKFCRECGGSLEVNCLSCNGNVSIWEKICDHCGANQILLLESQRSKNLEVQKRAESLLESQDLVAAKEAMKGLGISNDFRFRDQATWVKDFIQRLDAEHKRLVNQAVENISASLKLEEQYKYEAAIEQLTRSSSKFLRDEVLPGQNESIATILDRYQAKLSEMRRLETEVREKVKNKNYENLIPLVDKLLSLDPGRQSFANLKQQLIEREDKLRQRTKEALSLAREALVAQDYAQCLELIRKIDVCVADEEVLAVKQDAENKLHCVQKLNDRISEAISEKKLDGLIDVLDEYLLLKRNDPSREQLRQTLIRHRDQQIARFGPLMIELCELKNRAQYGLAMDKLSQVPVSYRSPQLSAMSVALESLRDAREQFMSAFLKAKQGAGWETAFEKGNEYRSLQMTDGAIKDEEFDWLFVQCQNARGREFYTATAFYAVIVIVAVYLLYLAFDYLHDKSIADLSLDAKTLTQQDSFRKFLTPPFAIALLAVAKLCFQVLKNAIVRMSNPSENVNEKQ